jgi:cytochrome c oxidase assembly factor CtaG
VNVTLAGSQLLAGQSPPPISHHLGATQIALTPSVLIAAGVALYLWAVSRVNRQDVDTPWSGRRTLAFMIGMAVTFCSIELFIGVYDTSLFYDHMIQHLLLIMVAAPLIAMGAPVELLARSTSGGLHRIVRRALDSRVAEVVGHPITGFALYAVFIPVAHLTSLYNVTLTHPVAQDAEHVAFLVVGYLFWRTAVGIEPSRHPLGPGLRMIYLMLSVPIDTFTGLTLVSTNHEIFPAFTALHRTWGPSLVTDLHIGGAIMWVGGDTLMIVGLIPIVVQWVRSEEERARRIDALLDREYALDGDAAPPGTHVEVDPIPSQIATPDQIPPR